MAEARPGKVLLDAAEIRRIVRRLARAIDADAGGRPLHLITLLKGGVFFLTDLCRELRTPVSIDFLGIAPYGPHSGPGGVRLTKDLDDSIEDRHVLLVEDIVDTGLTLSYLMRVLQARNPASLKLCTLFDRPYRRLIDVPIDHVGHVLPDAFVVGYGLDWLGLYRNLPYVAFLEESD